jgi:hypothetical protein
MQIVKSNQLKLGGYEMLKEGGKVEFVFKGFLTVENLGEFVADYNEIKSSINVKNTILILDTKELKVFPKNLENDLGNFYVDYTNFKKVYVINGNNIPVKLQLERMWRKHNIIDSFTYIDDVSEAK